MDLKSLRKLKFKREQQKAIGFKPNPSLLLHPNIPMPMHGCNPRTVLGKAWWDRERRACYKNSHHHCEACGVHASEAKGRQWMEAHESYTIDYKKGRLKYVRAISLCHYCHNYIHDGRMQHLLQAGKLTHAKYATIIQHGDAILTKAGLSRPGKADRDADTLSQEIAPWGEWRLQIGHKLYPPVFATPQQYWAFQQKIMEVE